MMFLLNSPKKLKSVYEGFFLKLLPTYSGCRVAIRVNAHTLPDQSVVYEPMYPLPPDLDVFILIIPKNTNIEAVSNKKMRVAYNPTYFFSNAAISVQSNLPFLSAPVLLTDTTHPYEQGELSMSAGGKIQQYYLKSSVDTWQEIPGGEFANEGDRVLIPKSFTYTLPEVTGLTELKFVLTDFAGSEISSVTVTDSNGIVAKHRLDFSDMVQQVPISKPFVVNELFYTLKVSGNNGFEDAHQVVFADDLLASNPWGVVDLRVTNGSGTYDIIAGDNFIQRRKDPVGNWNDAPVFEIAVTSKLAYWRFISNKGRELVISAPLNNYVTKTGHVIETLKPRALAKHFFSISKDLPMSTDTIYVPNPEIPGVKLENDHRIFFDIRVTNSDLFPELP